MAVLLLVALLPSCRPALVPVGLLAAHPERFDRKRVAVVGTVGDPIYIPEWSAFELADSATATTAIAVATRSGAVPLPGIQLGVQGEFRAHMEFLHQIRPALLEARRWNPAGRRGAATGPGALPRDSS